MDKVIHMDNKTFTQIRTLFGLVLTLSLVTLGITATVNASTAMWVRGGIVTAVAVLLLVFAGRARRGHRGAYRRIRFMTAIAPLGVAAIVAIPHDGFPLWMKAEQAAIGVLLLAAAVLLNRRSVRRAFTPTTVGTAQGTLAR